MSLSQERKKKMKIAGKKLGIAASLFAASISSTTLIGQSGDSYHTGLAVFNYNLTVIILMVLFAVFRLPR